MPPLHVVISTHTTRHLRRTLLGLACQSRRPDGVLVSCDNDDPAIAALVGACLREFDLSGRVLQRPHAGAARLNQVRNNGLRALLEDVEDQPVVVLLDGDCVLRSDAVAMHERICSPRTLVVGFRHDLTELQTEQFDEEALRGGQAPVGITAEQQSRLNTRARRYRRQTMLKRLGLSKSHKPKPLGAHMSFRLVDAANINGFDERYEGYGQDDDDFGRRMYQSGCRPVVAVDQVIAYHLYHPTRAPADWHSSPNARLFQSGGAVACEFGLRTPKAQDPVMETIRYVANSATKHLQADQHAKQQD